MLIYIPTYLYIKIAWSYWAGESGVGWVGGALLFFFFFAIRKNRRAVHGAMWILFVSLCFFFSCTVKDLCKILQA